MVWALPRPTDKLVFLWIWTFLPTLQGLAEVPGWRVSLVSPVAAHYPDPARTPALCYGAAGRARSHLSNTQWVPARGSKQGGTGAYLTALGVIWQIALPGKASGCEWFPRAGVLRTL